MHSTFAQRNHVIHGFGAPVHVLPAIGAGLALGSAEHSTEELHRQCAVGLADRLLESLASILSAGLTPKYSNALLARLADDLLTQ
jgi:hypothetical protein